MEAVTVGGALVQWGYIAGGLTFIGMVLKAFKKDKNNFDKRIVSANKRIKELEHDSGDHKTKIAVIIESIKGIRADIKDIKLMMENKRRKT